MCDFAELEGGERGRQQAGIGQAADPFQGVDDARIGPWQLAGEQLAVIVGPELLQQCFVRQMRAGERAVAGPKRHRHDAFRLRLLRHVEECVTGKLEILGHLHAEFVHELLVVINLHGPRLERQAVRFALVAPRLLRPRLDVRPVQVREVEQEAIFVILGLVGLGIEDVRRLSGTQRGLERGIERVLLVPGCLDLDARVLLLEVGDRLFDVLPLDLLGRPVRPERQFLLLRLRGSNRKNGRDGERDEAREHDDPSRVRRARPSAGRRTLLSGPR